MLVLLERTTLKTNMTMETQPFEDACAIKNGDFPASHVSFTRGYINFHDLRCYQNNLRCLTTVTHLQDTQLEFAAAQERANLEAETPPRSSNSSGFPSQSQSRIIADPWDWYIYLHLGDFYGKCR